MAQVLSLFHIISYLPIPIALYVFRRNVSKKKYPFRVRGGYIIAPALFAMFTYLFTLADIRIVVELFIIFAIFQAIFVLINLANKDGILAIMKQCAPLLVYFVGLAILTSFSPNNYTNMNPILFAVITVVFSLIFFFWLIRTEKEDIGLHKSIVNIYQR